MTALPTTAFAVLGLLSLRDCRVADGLNDLPVGFFWQLAALRGWPSRSTSWPWPSDPRQEARLQQTLGRRNGNSTSEREDGRARSGCEAARRTGSPRGERP